MKGILIFLIFLNLVIFKVCAQDDDYVISNPTDIKKEIKPTTNSTLNTVPNPDFTNYFVSSSAYTLKKNTFRLSGTDVVFVKGSYGLTDNTTVSVNLSLFGTVNASIKQKININEDIKLGISASVGRLFFLPPDTTVFNAGGEAMVTLGDVQDNLSVGTGFYYVKSNFDLINEEKELFIHTVYIGAQKQISRKMYLMAEVIYLLNDKVLTGAIGIKLVVGNRISLNFGLMPGAWNNPSNNKFSTMPGAIPLISFRMLLGGK